MELKGYIYYQPNVYICPLGYIAHFRKNSLKIPEWESFCELLKTSPQSVC